MYIYKITNNINNKCYVGQTVRTVDIRYKEHFTKYSKNSKYKSALYNAMEKYGKENFSVNTIEECDCLSNLNEREIFWIKELNTLAPNGYNLKTGGSSGGNLSEITKQKIREKHLGKKASKETRLKLRNSHLGHKHTIETKKKLSAINKGKKPSAAAVAACKLKLSKTYYFISPLGKPIKIINMKEFCIKNNLSPSKMSSVANKKRNHHKQWKLNDSLFENIQRR